MPPLLAALCATAAVLSAPLVGNEALRGDPPRPKCPGRKAAMQALAAQPSLLNISASPAPEAGNLRNLKAAPRASSGCGLTPPPNGQRFIDVQDPLAGATQRRFRLYVPSTYDAFEATPLILDFHGYSITSDRHAEESAFQDIAEQNRFIVAWPHGLDDTVIANQQAYSWNGVGTVGSPGPFGQTCQWASSSAEYACHTSCRGTRGCSSNRYANGCDCSTCADDVLFIELVMNALQDQLCIDPTRIHATGFSNGGMFTYSLAQSRLAARIASVAPVSSSPLMGFNLGPARSGMAIMDFHGSRDSIIPANCTGNQCGPQGSPISCDGFYYVPVERAMSSWGSANTCSGAPYQYETRYDGVTALWCVAQEGRCANRAEVVRCTHSGGHAYPFGQGAAARRQFATLVHEFFSQHPLE